MDIVYIQNLLDELLQAQPEDNDATLQALINHRLHLQVTQQIGAILASHPDEPTQIQAFKEFLENHWRDIKSTSICYTAQPQSEITKLLIGIATLVAEKEGTNTLGALMPGIYQESFHDAYLDLQGMEIPELLKTHVLSTDGTYLHPVRLVLEESIDDAARAEFPYNPYYDFADEEKQHARLTQESYQRLETHSPLTEAVINARRNYQKLTTGSEDLLSQLHQLIRQLGLNSASARGEEENAAGGAYPAIIAFNEYYQSLPEEAKDKVPQALKSEINLLLNLSSDAAQNINATENIQTCIASRRSELLSAMQGHDTLLSEVSIGEPNRAKLIEAARKEFEDAKEALEKALGSTPYKGKDTLGVSITILDKLKIPITITSPEDLKLLIQGLPIESLGFLNHADVKAQVMMQLSSLENLVIAIMDMPPDKLEGVLSVLLEDIKPLILGPNDLAALLISLEVEKVEITLRVLKDKLPDIIQTGYDFNDAMQHLSEPQQNILLEAMKDKLQTEIIKGLDDFVQVMQNLSEHQQNILLEVMKDKFPDIIEGSHDFVQVMQNLSVPQQNILLEAMQHKLQTEIIKTASDFERAMQYLSDPQRDILFKAMQNRLPDIIKGSDDFVRVMQNLSVPQRDTLLEAMTDKFPDIIKDLDDFEEVMQNLSEHQRDTPLEAMKDRLPDIIKTEYDFKQAMQHLSLEQLPVFLEFTKNNLLESIQSEGLQYLKDVMVGMAANQINTLLDRIEADLPDLIIKMSTKDLSKKVVAHHLEANLNGIKAFLPEDRASKLQEKIDSKLSIKNSSMFKEDMATIKSQNNTNPTAEEPKNDNNSTNKLR